jgi:hypothetical protein
MRRGEFMSSSPKGVADHPNKEDIESWWRAGLRAKDIVERLESEGLPAVSVTTLGRYGQRYWNDVVKIEVEEASDLSDRLSRLSEIGHIKKVNVRDSITRTGTSSSTTVEIIPSISSVVPILDRGPKVVPKFSFKVSKRERKPDGWKVGIKLPDMQIGYWGDGKQHVCTHDEAAINVAHQIVADVESRYGLDLLLNVGDNIDLPAFGSHRSAPGFMQTTQMAIDRATEEGAIERALAPDADIVWLQGNHEQRLTNYLVDKAPALVGLARGGETDPVLSVARLCRFDEQGINYLEPYPDAEYWVNEHLRFEHGHIYSSSPGGTAAKHLSEGVSVGYGHIHRQEMLQMTRHTKRGPRTHFAGSAGCLCKIDGAVPSSKTGINSKGRQASQKAENWQQGIWVFWWQPEGDQLVAVEPVSIWGGWAMFRGVQYVSGVDTDRNPLV